MNAIFGLVLITSNDILIFVNPDAALAAMLSGGEKALSLTLKMVVIYAVWLGVLNFFHARDFQTKLRKVLNL